MLSGTVISHDLAPEKQQQGRVWCLQAVQDGGKICRLTMAALRGPSHHCVRLL